MESPLGRHAYRGVRCVLAVDCILLSSAFGRVICKGVRFVPTVDGTLLSSAFGRVKGLSLSIYIKFPFQLLDILLI